MAKTSYVTERQIALILAKKERLVDEFNWDDERFYSSLNESGKVTDEFSEDDDLKKLTKTQGEDVAEYFDTVIRAEVDAQVEDEVEDEGDYDEGYGENEYEEDEENEDYDEEDGEEEGDDED